MLKLFVVSLVLLFMTVNAQEDLIPSDKPYLGAGLPLTPAEEAVADRAAARSAAMAAAARF